MSVLQWAMNLTSEETADDSDKTFTVPAGEEWQVVRIWVELTSTAEVGNRQLAVEIQDSASDVIGQPARVRVTQAASLTYYYEMAVAAKDDTEVYDTDYVSQSLPVIWLAAGQKLRVYDNNAVDADGDDMVVQVQYAKRRV